jgi:hypothetical protein
MSQDSPILTIEASVTSKASPDAVYNVLADLSTHLQWAGEQAARDDFKLLSLQAPKGRASVGTTFTSTGANSKDGSSTFHDESIVTEATAPSLFAFVTDAHLERKRRPTWQVRFVHRYDVQPEGTGSRISYTASVYPVNYRPYWLHPIARPMTRMMVKKYSAKHMENLSALAEKATSRARVR